MHLKQLARDGLLKPLQAVSGIVERRHTLPILSNVLVEQSDGRLSVTATDLEIQITAQSEVAVPEGGDYHSCCALHSNRMVLDENVMARGIAMHCAFAEAALADGIG